MKELESGFYMRVYSDYSRVILDGLQSKKLTLNHLAIMAKITNEISIGHKGGFTNAQLYRILGLGTKNISSRLKGLIALNILRKYDGYTVINPLLICASLTEKDRMDQCKEYYKLEFEEWMKDSTEMKFYPYLRSLLP
jgi:hypothetical protein